MLMFCVFTNCNVWLFNKVCSKKKYIYRYSWLKNRYFIGKQYIAVSIKSLSPSVILVPHKQHIWTHGVKQAGDHNNGVLVTWSDAGSVNRSMKPVPLTCPTDRRRSGTVNSVWAQLVMCSLSCFPFLQLVTGQTWSSCSITPAASTQRNTCSP